MSSWAEAQYVIDSLKDTVRSGALYFSDTGDFRSIIQRLGKNPSDFTANNFRQLVNGAYVYYGIPEHGKSGSGTSGIVYNDGICTENFSGSINTTLSSGRLTIRNSDINPAVGGFSKYYGYIFDPSGEWKVAGT